MKIEVLLLAALTLFVAACSSENAQMPSEVVPIEKAEIPSRTASQEANWMISDTAIGPFFKGAFIEQEKEVNGMKLIEKEESLSDGSSRKYYGLSGNGVEALRIYPAIDPRTDTYTKLIGSISILSQKYKDKGNISVGSAVKDFYSSYPSAYAYFDLVDNNLILSKAGHGPRYIVDGNAIQNEGQIDISKIQKEQITQNARIKEIQIVRSSYENQDAMKNKGMEAEEILEGYLGAICGKYYLKEYSENYYKIHKLQGDFLVSECNEGDCKDRGKIIACKKNKDMISLSLEGISGEMVPSWTILQKSTGLDDLHVHDYNAFDDKWTDKIFTKGDL